MDFSELNILIVEDDPIIAQDIKSLVLHEGGKVAGIAKNGTRALDLLSQSNANFAILDIHLGTGLSGIDIAELIHSKYQIPYIFLTSFSDPETLSAAQEQGPYGYLVKPFQDRTLVTTIVTAWVTFKKNNSQHDVDWSKWSNVLTQREIEITKKLLDGLSYKQICDVLFISMNTLKYHVKNIYSKFDIKGRNQLHLLMTSQA